MLAWHPGSTEKTAVVDILVLNGSRAGACFTLPDVPTVLGRSPEAHLRIDDPWISNMHALFEPRGQVHWVVDLGSRNGTFVGEERVEEAPIAVGAVLSFGRTEVRVEAHSDVTDPAADPTKTPLRLDAIRATVRTERPGAMTLPGIHAAGTADPFVFMARPLALLRLSFTLPPGGTPPEAQAIRSALDTAARAVMREGGRTTRLGSGGLVAIFGFGGPAFDDAARALRAALAAREDLLTLAPELSARFAVDAGPAVAGMVSGPEGADLVALGETPDRVERLAALASPGEILVGPGVPLGADPRLEPLEGPVPALPDGLRRLRAG
jgi:hypothetical protein